MRVFHGLDAKRIFEVPVLVTRDPFRLLSRSEIIGDLSVCYMPRKCTNDAFHIRREVMKTFPDIPWVEIDKRPIREVAALLRSSKVFLSTQENEGFGLPAIEAMSCGCIVAGYSGTPGFPHPYATPSNGLWAKDRDAASAVRKTIEAIRIAREGGKAAQSIANAAWHTVRRFDVSSVDIALKEFLEVTSVQAYSARTQPRQAMSMATYVASMKHLRRVGRLHFREQLRHIVRKIL
jgi:glycosyltransferase involved in cell wall biosynthesis